MRSLVARIVRSCSRKGRETTGHELAVITMHGKIRDVFHRVKERNIYELKHLVGIIERITEDRKGKERR